MLAKVGPDWFMPPVSSNSNTRITVDHPLADESELVKRMLAGDQRAFDAFFDGHFARLYRFALPRLGGDPAAAREVVQATLGKAMRKLAHFRGEAAIFTWLCQICRRWARR